MITQIESSIIQRLTLGMGRMLREVANYSGELDVDMGNIIRAFPAAWVTFGGITNSKYTSTSRQKVIVTGKFVVMVGDYNTRSDAASRTGGANLNEVGTYRHIHGVRRLLTGQDLGLTIDPLMPGVVRTLYNTQVNERALSIFACEFETRWHEHVLANGDWPEFTRNPDEADNLFNLYRGKLQQPDPDLLRVGLHYDPPGVGSAEAPADLVPTRKPTP
ncbi:DUF1834 family protein [Providencia huaxiensis]|uniref:DUF1834 family protein n=1 Tax=Providencia huaxiensis TaxID=2027290 RepID=UPI001EE7F949|nr:DUF1834 family protein [Providencia huaxiensis]